MNERSITFTLHVREQDFAARLVRIGERFGIRPALKQYGNTLRVQYHSVRLVEWFRREFGGASEGRAHTGARHKRIPAWMLVAPQAITAAFLQGLWDADGTEHSPGHRSLVTSSLDVADAIRIILARLGFFPTMLLTQDNHYLIRWGGDFQWGKLDEDYLLLPIRELSLQAYEGPVYNIEVAEDHSYVTEFAVHNCEKSTMNDVLVPLCRDYGANLQTGLGELSITATLALVNRLQEANKPARIFYVSDFDPAGQSMPVSVSRKIEYFVRTLGLSLDVRVFPVILTLEQVQYYQLPRTPIKETERRRGGFEDRYGQGAVELDALEALYPGELQNVLRTFMNQYYDVTLDERVDAVRLQLEHDLASIKQMVLSRFAPEIASLRQEHARLQADFEGRMEGYSQALKSVWLAMKSELDLSLPNLEAYQVPQPYVNGELGDGLYNSERDYLEQIEAYKQFQGKLETAEE